MGGHPAVLYSTLMMENPKFWTQKKVENKWNNQWIQNISHTKSNGIPLKTHGFKAFLVLTFMNPIPNLVTLMFGFAANYFEVKTFSWI